MLNLKQLRYRNVTKVLWIRLFILRLISVKKYIKTITIDNKLLYTRHYHPSLFLCAVVMAYIYSQSRFKQYLIWFTYMRTKIAFDTRRKQKLMVPTSTQFPAQSPLI
jgi:hypothetical protein